MHFQMLEKVVILRTNKDQERNEARQNDSPRVKRKEPTFLLHLTRWYRPSSQIPQESKLFFEAKVLFPRRGSCIARRTAPK